MKNKKMTIIIILLAFFVINSITWADSYSVPSSSKDSCSIAMNQNLSFSVPHMIYDAGPSAGQMEMQVAFEYFGEQNGDHLWKVGNIRANSLSACPINLTSDLSFGVPHMIYDAGPSAGQMEIQVVFEYFGEQNDFPIWRLVHINPLNPVASPAISTDDCLDVLTVPSFFGPVQYDVRLFSKSREIMKRFPVLSQDGCVYSTVGIVSCYSDVLITNRVLMGFNVEVEGIEFVYPNDKCN